MGANHSHLNRKEHREPEERRVKRSGTLSTFKPSPSRLNLHLFGLGKRSPQPPATPVSPQANVVVEPANHHQPGGFGPLGIASPQATVGEPEDRPDISVSSELHLNQLQGYQDPPIMPPAAMVPCQYRTGRTLGSGTYAIVKEAIHIKTGQYFACKVINKKLMEGRENMVRNEIAVLKKVSSGHSNIVTLHDYFETSHNLYLCFDLCTGGELFDSICARGQYTEADAAELVRTIFGAVKYIHNSGIVHRDLKPENLLFRSKPEKTSEIMIADFGLSRVMPEDKLSLLTEVCGTPGYMAPEIFKKVGHGKPVDVWAMGVITYFLLAGYTPFDRDTQKQEMEAIIAGDYRFEPEEYWCNVSETARGFVSTCLTVDPASRPTADQMLEHPWLAAEVPHFVEGEDGKPADLLPHVRKAFDARKTFRKAVFGMMAMKRMSMLAQEHHHQLSHLSPEQHQLNEDVYQFKQESEKETLENADVLHHHNADENPDVHVHPHGDSVGQPQGENNAALQLPPTTTPGSSERPASTIPSEGTKESKDVSEKLAAVSLAAKKVFGRLTGTRGGGGK